MITLLLLSLLTGDVCKSVLLNKGEPAPCSGILIDKAAADSTYDTIQNLYPTALSKISLLEQSLKVDDKLIDDFRAEVVILKKNVAELLDFSKTSVLDYDKAQKLQSVIVGVAVVATIVGMVLVTLAVGYAVKSFAPTLTVGQVLQ